MDLGQLEAGDSPVLRLATDLTGPMRAFGGVSYVQAFEAPFERWQGASKADLEQMRELYPSG
jgi:hypothetical protein